MGKPAARTGDLAGHMGAILIGSTNVFIGGMPAARKGDSLTCPIHGVGVITQGSTTVLINGMPAARMTDLTGCMTFGMSAISIPLILGPSAMPGFGPGGLPASPPAPPVPPAPPAGAPPLKGAANGSPQFAGKSHEDTDNKGNGAMAIHAEGQVTDTDKDGSYDTVEGATEAVRMRNQAYGNLGPIEGGVTHGMDVFYGNAKGTVRSGAYGDVGASGSAEVGALKWGVGGSLAGRDSQGRNPGLAVAGEANMFHAKAEGDLLNGSDGVRTGVIVKGEAGAEVLQGEATGTATTFSVFGYNAQGKAKVGASAGSAAVGGGVWLYYDHSERRLHAGISAGLAALVGLKFDLGFSIGQEYKDPAAPPPAPPPAPTPPAPPAIGPMGIDFMNTPGFGAGGIPGTIMFGCMNVLIGG